MKIHEFNFFSFWKYKINNVLSLIFKWSITNPYSFRINKFWLNIKKNKENTSQMLSETILINKPLLVTIFSFKRLSYIELDMTFFFMHDIDKVLMTN